jgi:hypothetical protein
MYEGCEKHFPEDAPADAAEAMEKAWTRNAHVPVGPSWYEEFCVTYVIPWLNDRRTSRDRSMMPVLVSREAVEALREAGEPYDIHAPEILDHARAKACVLLARDLAPLLKRTP